MFPRLHPAPELRNLAYHACADAVQLAGLQRDGRAWAVLCWPETLAETPVADFAAAEGRGRILLWQGAGRGDEWLLGVGAAATIAVSGPGRTMIAAQELARLESRCVIVAPTTAPALPLVLSALAFTDDPKSDGAWGRTLPGARLVLPRRLLWRRSASESWIIAALEVTAEDETPEAINDFVNALLAAPAPLTAEIPAPWTLAKVDFAPLVEDAIALIRDGAMRKVVLARARDLTAAVPFAAESILERLPANADAETTIYAYDLDDGGCYLGATPELLFAAEGPHLTTGALAGSTRRGTDAAEDERLIAHLLGSTKERKEHQLVVEHLVNVLRPRCQPFTVPTAPHLRTLPRLHHLETALTVKLLCANHHDVLAALHPTPAVCGLPTPLALSYLSRHEHLERGLYAGVLGWSTPSACRFVVPLRGAIVRGQHARLFAGAGIVETSDPAAEVAEIALKMRSMEQALGLAGTADAQP